jgi:hypothetical protein
VRLQDEKAKLTMALAADHDGTELDAWREKSNLYKQIFVKHKRVTLKDLVDRDLALMIARAPALLAARAPALLAARAPALLPAWAPSLLAALAPGAIEKSNR